MQQPSHTDYFNTPIFVLGLPRSGTSLIAGILEICGTWLGNTVPGGGVENPKGFFENIYLREQVNKKILSSLGADTLGVKRLPALESLPPVNGLKPVIRSGLEENGYDYSRPWLFKDAKLTLLWPIYHSAFPNAHWIIVRRDTKHIIASCLNTSFMKTHSRDHQFWAQWADEYLARLDALKSSQCTWSEIWTPKIINGEFDELATLVQQLDLQWRTKAVQQFINPHYWHYS